MKKITSILLLVAVFATMFTMTTFAAENTNVFTVTADKTSAAAGDAVYVTIQLDGDFTDAAMIQYSVKFDTDKFSTVTSGRAPWGFDATWYNSTKDGNPENLGYINTPSFGANPANQVNVLFLSTDGYYIDDAGALYGDGNSTVAGKIKFTAKADVDVIDASCFELLNAKVEDCNGTAHTVTVNQIEVAEEGPEYAYEDATVSTEVKVAKNEAYTDVFNNAIIATGSVAADTTADDFGIIFLKDGVMGQEHISMKSDAVAGEGTFEFGVVMYGIPTDVMDDITAQYYIYE